MKKFLVLIAVSLLGAGAMAQEVVNDEQADQAYAQELDQDQMQTFASPGQVIGGVIGGIIGGAIGGRDDHRGPGRGGDWGPGRGGPGRGGPGGGWGPGRGGPGRGGPGRPQAWVCYARNLRGQTFQANDWDQRRASQMALNECARVSARCQPAGCQAY